jgi:thiol-disulfide isomerase/thioredoxin
VNRLSSAIGRSFILQICFLCDMIKRLLPIFILFICPLLAAAQGFTIQGTVDGLPKGVVSIDYHNQNGDDTTIHAGIADGRFILKGTVAEPEAVRLTITLGWSYNVSFYLENSPIEIKMVKDADEKTQISGSKSNVTFEKLKPGLADFFDHARQNTAAHQQYDATHDARALHSAESLWSAQSNQWIQTIHSTIATDPDNYAALYYIKWLLFRPSDFNAIRSLYMELSPAVRKGWAAKKFIAELDQLSRTSPGGQAPDINGKDTTGKAVMLSAYKGKVILLDFWASYCGPCRQENKRMIPFYQKYYSEGFEIVSFSLDDQRSRWVQAILADGMTWPQASELRGGASGTAGVYDITDLPRNVLIDQTGKIYARDIHGDNLKEAVEKLLRKK